MRNKLTTKELVDHILPQIGNADWDGEAMMRGLVFGLALSAAALGGAAQAATVSFSGSSSNGPDIALGKFNTSLGTLTSVFFEVTGNAIDNDVEAGPPFSTVATAFASISVSFAGLNFSNSQFVSVPCTTPTTICFISITAKASLSGSGFVDNADFGLVSGFGTVLADVQALGDSSNVSVSVTYTYDDAVSTVPLPASGGMLLAGLGALAARRRRAA